MARDRSKDILRRKQLWQERLKNNLCAYCGKAPPKEACKWCASCLAKKYLINKRHLQKYPDKQRNYCRRLKGLAIAKYGGKCECCGEPHLNFLTIDHINNDGWQERRRLCGSQHISSTKWYLQLLRQEKRADLRVLCWNCNCATYFYGVCPHKEKGKLQS